jgi:hypothetical protein
MKVYHGYKSAQFKIENHINSRYGFPCLFFTDNIELAKNYSNNTVISAELNVQTVFDFNNGISHSLTFRNLIYSLRKKSVPVVKIRNVFDRPNENYPLELSDIYVVFDFNQINNIQLCTP